MSEPPAPTTIRPEDATLSWVLRLGVAACFIGHGALGFLGTPAWIRYFGVVGVGHETARLLLPWIGIFDISLGLSALFLPRPSLTVYMIVWTLWTALLRPLSGESFWEAIERAGNYGIPVALFAVLQGASRAGGWRESERLVRRLLLGTTVLVLLGHGLLGLVVRKPLFAAHYNAIGLPGAVIAPYVGAFECLLAAAVWWRPTVGLLVGVLAWKLATEALSPIAGSPVWVFVEHGGSYAAPAALACLVARRPRPAPLVPAPA